MMRIKVWQSAHFCWLDNTGMGTALLATHKDSRASAATVVSFNREDVEWANYKNKQGGIWCDHWSSCCNVICVCWMVQLRPVAYWSGPFIWHQWNDRLWDNYHRCIVCWTVCLPIMQNLVNVAVNWVCAWRSVHTWRVRYRTISGRRNNHKVANSVINIAILPNRYEHQRQRNATWCTNWTELNLCSMLRPHSDDGAVCVNTAVEITVLDYVTVPSVS